MSSARTPVPYVVVPAQATTPPGAAETAGDGPGRGGRFPFDLAVVGLGYVGLPTALALHAAGRRVAGFDISDERIAVVRGGDADLIESDRMRLRAANDDRAGFVLSSDPAILASGAAVLICVPTPLDDHLLPDLSALAAACETVVARAVPGQTLVLTSTTYVGCTREMLVEPLRRRGFTIGEDVFVAFAPERIDPGNVVHPYEQVPRVLGGATVRCARRASAALAGSSHRLHVVSSIEAAEMTKLYENTFRAVNISLANEFADIGGAFGLDITEIIDAAATKPYGFMPFRPGPGVGGHCIPCDPHYLLWQLRSNRMPAPLIEAAMTAIAVRPGQVVRSAVRLLAGTGRSPRAATVLVHGVAYKPGVADVRESPALEIIRRLRDLGAEVSFSDRMVTSVLVGGVQIKRVDEPWRTRWDLVIVHTPHPGDDTGWLGAQPAVLDTTYRLGGPGTHRIGGPAEPV